jgi:hypothetical protein
MYQLITNYFPDGSINSESNAVLKDGCITIPFDPANTDYAAYLEWVEQGGTPEPAPEPVAPVELTTEQKLEAAGLTVAELRELFGLPAPEA